MKLPKTKWGFKKIKIKICTCLTKSLLAFKQGKRLDMCPSEDGKQIVHFQYTMERSVSIQKKGERNGGWLTRQNQMKTPQRRHCTPQLHACHLGFEVVASRSHEEGWPFPAAVLPAAMWLLSWTGSAGCSCFSRQIPKSQPPQSSTAYITA